MRCKGGVLPVALAALVGVVVGAALLWVAIQREFISEPRAAAAGRPTSSVPDRALRAVSRESQDAITAAIARVGPAVVNINTLFRPRVRRPIDRMLRDFMGVPVEPFPRAGQGSGIIIDGEGGYVLTNAHVVKGAQQIQVSLADRRRLEAKVVGLDPLSEIAVLQVPGGDLPEASLGSAEALPIGSWVIAIGNPFGFENSVTVGVISARDRQIESPNGVVLQDLLQTDASINPGNSGGALVDLNGNVVGVPTAIIPYAQGMGFAVSIDVAKQVVERLIATGEMPWLGVSHRNLMPREVDALGLAEARGTLVLRVVPGGPAYRAGIRPGDVITQLGEERVADAKALGNAVRAHDAGVTVSARVVREGREMTLSVTLGAVPAEGFA